ARYLAFPTKEKINGYGWTSFGRTADEWRGVSGVFARWSRSLHLRRAREGRHDPSGLSQYSPHGGSPVSRAARAEIQGQVAAADRHRQRRLHTRIFQSSENG